MITAEQILEYCDLQERLAHDNAGRALLKGDPDDASIHTGRAEAYAHIAGYIATHLPRVHTHSTPT